MSKERTVTVISKKGEFSVHSSFTKACISYKWDRKEFRTVPSLHQGYSIRKISMNVSIDCLELMEFSCQKTTTISYENNYKENQTFRVEFYGPKKVYFVIVNVEKKLEKAWDNGNDGGHHNTGGGYYNFIAESILEVLDGNGDEMNVDEHTKEFLLDLISIEETEDYED